LHKTIKFIFSEHKHRIKTNP